MPLILGTVLKESWCLITYLLHLMPVPIRWCCYSLKFAYRFTSQVARPSFLPPHLPFLTKIIFWGLLLNFVLVLEIKPRALAACFRFVSVCYQIFLSLSDFFTVFTKIPWKTFPDVLPKAGCSVLPFPGCQVSQSLKVPPLAQAHGEKSCSALMISVVDLL